MLGRNNIFVRGQGLMLAVVKIIVLTVMVVMCVCFSGPNESRGGGRRAVGRMRAMRRGASRGGRGARGGASKSRLRGIAPKDRRCQNFLLGGILRSPGRKSVRCGMCVPSTCSKAGRCTLCMALPKCRKLCFRNIKRGVQARSFKFRTRGCVASVVVMTPRLGS